MLSLSRRRGEKVVIRIGAEKVIVQLVELAHGKARLGFSASKHITINREEIDDMLHAVSTPAHMIDEGAPCHDGSH